MKEPRKLFEIKPRVYFFKGFSGIFQFSSSEWIKPTPHFLPLFPFYFPDAAWLCSIRQPTIWSQQFWGIYSQGSISDRWYPWGWRVKMGGWRKGYCHGSCSPPGCSLTGIILDMDMCVFLLCLFDAFDSDGLGKDGGMNRCRRWTFQSWTSSQYCPAVQQAPWSKWLPSVRAVFFSSSSFSSESTECIFTLAWRRLCSKIIEQNSVSAGDLEVCLRYGPPCYVHGILVLKSNQIQVFTHSPQKAVFGLFVLRFASANTPSLLKQHSQACYSETLSTLTLVAKVVAASHFSQIVRLKFKVYNEFGRPSKKIYQ